MHNDSEGSAAAELAANRKIIDEFRANDGQLGRWYGGGPLLLLRSVGAKSGLARVSPVLYRDLGGSYAIFASFRGSPRHPAWYFNLLAHPTVDIEIGGDVERVVARVAQGEERQRIWNDHQCEYPNFVRYEAMAHRTIPVVVLEPCRSTDTVEPVIG